MYSVKNELNIDNENHLLPQSDLSGIEIENFPNIEDQVQKVEKTKTKRVFGFC